MEEDRIVAIAVHSKGKALILKDVLESRGIPVFLEELPRSGNPAEFPEGIAVKIKESQVSKALMIIEANKLFNYEDIQTYKIDDGRKRVLVAVDFSPYSMKACYVAFEIAHRMGAKVKILHVFNNIYYPSHIPFADILKEEDEVGLLDRSRKKMLDLCVEIDQKIAEGELPSVNYSYSLREGIVDEEVNSFVEEYKPALLVLGTKGKDNNRNHLLGGITADIIEMTDVPVLAVPEKVFVKDVTSMKHLAFFMGMNKSDLVSFDFLINSISAYKDVNITLVHVNITSKKSEKIAEMELLGLKEFFNKKHPEFKIGYKLISASDPIETIPLVKDFVEKEDVNVIVTNTRRRNIFGRIFIPSNSRKILTSMDVALLVLRGDSLMKQMKGMY